MKTKPERSAKSDLKQDLKKSSNADGKLRANYTLLKVTQISVSNSLQLRQWNSHIVPYC